MLRVQKRAGREVKGVFLCEYLRELREGDTRERLGRGTNRSVLERRHKREWLRSARAGRRTRESVLERRTRVGA